METNIGSFATRLAQPDAATAFQAAAAARKEAMSELMYDRDAGADAGRVPQYRRTALVQMSVFCFA